MVEYRESEYRESEYRESEYGESEYRESEYRESEYRESGAGEHLLLLIRGGKTKTMVNFISYESFWSEFSLSSVDCGVV